MVGRTSDWKEDLGRFLNPFLARLDHKARQDDRSGHDNRGALFVCVRFPDNRWFAIIVLVVVFLFILVVVVIVWLSRRHCVVDEA